MRSVISVDGPLPDLASADRHGIRYIHLPIGYDTITPLRREQLIQAARDLPRPIYIHCHHGKHRSATAAGFMAIAMGWMDAQAALERMRVAGTSAQYEGLWKCIRSASAWDNGTIDRLAGELPQGVEPTSLVAAMLEVDECADTLKRLQRAGWEQGSRQGQLEAASRLADALRSSYQALAGECSPALPPPDAEEWIEQAIANATRLEEQLSSLMRHPSPDASEGANLDALLRSITATCTGCHARHRDRDE